MAATKKSSRVEVNEVDLLDTLLDDATASFRKQQAAEQKRMEAAAKKAAADAAKARAKKPVAAPKPFTSFCG